MDFCFEVSGHPAALEMARAMTAKGGEVVGVGVNRPDTQFAVNHLAWVCNEQVLRGSYMGGGVPQDDIPRYVDIYLRGRLPVEQLRSEHITFDQLNEAFDALHSGKVIRQILLPHGMV